MKNKGFIQVITILLILVSIYQVSFTFRTRAVERKAKSKAEALFSGDVAAQKKFTKQYLDSMNNEVVYNLGIGKFTYQECKEEQLNLGLDLQGGMNVTLEVATPEIVRMMAGDTKNKNFIAALDEAEKEFLGQQNFIDLLAQKLKKIAPNEKIAPIFYSKELKDQLPNQSLSSNQEIFDYLKVETNSAIDRAFEIISARIDKFGVAQPNIQKLDNGRILVELPGVDDPTRIRQILQSSAKLQFWNVFQNFEAYKYLESANKIIASQKGSDTSAKKTESIAPVEDGLLAADESTEAVSGTEETPKAKKDSSLTGDLASAEGDSNIQKSTEEIQAENPVLSLLIPNITQDGKNWGNGAHVGFVPASKMSEFDEMLNTPEVKAIMPSNLYWKWGFKSFDGKGEFFELFALKSNRDGKPALEGDVITDARPSRQPNGEMKVSMTMNQEGTRAWKLVTANASQQNPKEAIAIVLDDRVYSAPTVQSEIPTGMSEISGNFTQRDADDLSNILKAGKLPAPAKITGESTVGPTLGARSIKAGIIALIVGFLAVVGFMILYYGKAGIYADIALFVNLILIVGILAGLHAALTLPGMAGLVLTIGMAVDANVLIFERIREELKNGKSFKMAVKDGYAGAYSSIIDANITTLIAGVILWILGKGPVMGFAVILVIGILSSLFTAIFLTRWFIERDIEKGRETSFYSRFFKERKTGFNFDFMGNRKKFYISSGIVIVIGLVSLFTKGLSTGVDFKGGWSYIVQIENTNAQAVKSALNKAFDANNEVKTYGENNQFRITTSHLINSKDAGASDKVESDIINALSSLNVNKESILSSSKVGPTIAKDIKVRSTWAIVLALIGMFLYIVARFRRVGFGLGATVALFHDVLIVLSLYSIFWGILPFALDIDQAFIAAILTVVGYSINDTVVVFDRIREFLGMTKNRQEDLVKVVNDSVNQTLSRTLITSLTTFIVILILFLFGGEGLRGFTFALLIGVAVGTYSSICVATPVVVDFLNKFGRKGK